MKNKKTPLISIVTPSYNQGQFLEDTIKSVVNQNYPNFEYIIIDGESTDNSIEVIKKYEEYLTYWVSEPDKGQADAINKGFLKAKGDLLAWINSDDMYFPGIFKRMANEYIKNPNASIYVGALAIGNEEGKIQKCYIPYSYKWETKYGLLRVKQPATFFNRNICENVGTLNNNLYIRMDGDYIYRLLKENNEMIKVHALSSYFRLHNLSKSSTSENRIKREKSEFFKDLPVSSFERVFALYMGRVFHLISGDYFRNLLLTYQYKDKNIYNIWKFS